MAVTAASIKAFAPELAAVADSIVNTWIGWAPGYVAAAVFGADHDQAVTLWTCHQLVRQKASATIGPVTGRTVGDVSTTSAASDSASLASSYGTTAYGVLLQVLIRRYTAGPRVVT